MVPKTRIRTAVSSFPIVQPQSHYPQTVAVSLSKRLFSFVRKVVLELPNRTLRPIARLSNKRVISPVESLVLVVILVPVVDDINAFHYTIDNRPNNPARVARSGARQNSQRPFRGEYRLESINPRVVCDFSVVRNRIVVFFAFSLPGSFGDKKKRLRWRGNNICKDFLRG